jgi:glycosyltransferase involved in cell wall biosynthesis
MHFFALGLAGFTALFWILHGLRMAYGAMRLPWLKQFEPLANSECPRVSLIFAARDEEEKLPAALATLAALDYPHLEIIAADDRSKDATGSILDGFAVTHSNFSVVHIQTLPPGWLGKPHALQQAYESSTGEYVLFTDADVRFKADSIGRAMALAQAKNLDHLTLFGDVEMHGFWEKVLLTFFGLAFHIATDPHRVSNPNSRAYVGVGAFQLLRRGAYEAMGTHRRLAMEVVDDMKLGKLVKEAGLRSCVGVAQDFVTVRWHAGAGNIIRGVTKNFFAAFGYNAWLAGFAVAMLLLLNVAPFIGVFAEHGGVRAFCAIAVAIALGFHVGVDVVMRVSPWYSLTHPLGAILFSYMVVRSVAVTLWHGGVTWRETFYPLKELKRKSV